MVNINKLHTFLSPMEPISFKRSQVILAKIIGDDQQANQKLSQLTLEIDKGKKIFGFFYAEEQLTQVLKERLW